MLPAKITDDSQAVIESATSQGFGQVSPILPLPRKLLLNPGGLESLPLASFPFPELAPISRDQVDFIVSQLQACIAQVVGGGKMPFIHHTAYRGSLPQGYQDLLGVSAMYRHKTPENKNTVFSMLDKNISRLFATSNSWALDELLLATQALVVYQIIRLFDEQGDIRQRANAERQSSILEAWTSRLYTAGNLSATEGAPPGKSAYDHWIVVESARRTVLVSTMLQCMYSLLRDGSCGQVPMMSNLPVSLCGRLWHKSEEEWWDTTSGADTELVTYREYVSKWAKGDALETEDYEIILLVACRHNALRLSLPSP